MPPPTTSIRCGELAELERAGRIDDARIARQPRQHRGLAAGGDDALIEVDELARAVALDLELLRRREARRAAHDANLALLRERLRDRS